MTQLERYQALRKQWTSRCDPCPFCGCELVLVNTRLDHMEHVFDDHEESYVWCVKCDAKGPSILNRRLRDQMRRAVDLWNGVMAVSDKED